MPIHRMGNQRHLDGAIDTLSALRTNTGAIRPAPGGEEAHLRSDLLVHGAPEGQHFRATKEHIGPPKESAAQGFNRMAKSDT
ncbi:hypothetical protein [Streptomyces flaveus]|uniref:hypothetical protein n=1 Tax=Streptomyces flaveus TaxID=66370 RepID=UPI0033272AD2